jgi:hypothetical protein
MLIKRDDDKLTLPAESEKCLEEHLHFYNAKSKSL